MDHEEFISLARIRVLGGAADVVHEALRRCKLGLRNLDLLPEVVEDIVNVLLRLRIPQPFLHLLHVRGKREDTVRALARRFANVPTKAYPSTPSTTLQLQVCHKVNDFGKLPQTNEAR